jgi:probable HAF family extracellular repeat protein
MHRYLLPAVLFLCVLLSALGAAHAASYTFTTIDVPGATLTEAYGVNAAGQIVGRFNDATGERHGFLKDGATFTTIDVPGATLTEAYGINAAGQIVGQFHDAMGHLHSFLKDGATFTTIDVPPGPPSGGTEPFAINMVGEIVGVFDDGPNHGFVATPHRSGHP